MIQIPISIKKKPKSLLKNTKCSILRSRINIIVRSNSDNTEIKAIFDYLFS